MSVIFRKQLNYIRLEKNLKREFINYNLLIFIALILNIKRI